MIQINRINLCLVSLILLPIWTCTANSQQKEWQIKSESAYSENHTFIYSGNAIFTIGDLLIRGDEIKVYKSAQGKTRLIQISGNPATLLRHKKSSAQASEEQSPAMQTAVVQTIELSAKVIKYQLDNRHITANEQVTLIQKNSPDNLFKVAGEQLSLPGNSHDLLEISGKPIEITISQPRQLPLKALADKMNYNQQTLQFEIVGNVQLSTGRDKIKAQKILYNSRTRALQIPKSPNHQVEMTQIIKENK